MLLAVAVVAVAISSGCTVAAEPRAKLTATGAVLLDGKPFLPIFVWAQPSSLMAFHKDLGINTMHPGEKAETDPPRAYLDKLQAAGMMGLVNMELFSDDLKGHPALLAWTVEHEPDVAQKPAFEADLSGDATVIWIEGEAATKSTLTRSSWLDVKVPQLSGKRWLTSEKEGTGDAVYQFEAKAAGTYTLWVREFNKNWANPTRWQLDGGQAKETPRSLRAEAVVNLGGGRGVGWANYGQVELAKGKHTLTLSIVPGRTAGKPDKEPAKEAIWAVDALCFTQAETYPPAKRLEPMPKRLPDVEKEHYQKIKAADPDALTWNILTAGFFGPYHESYKLPMHYYEGFVKWTDVVTFDHYPVTGWNRPDRLPEVGLATRQLVSMCRPNEPVWTIVEASDQDLAWTAKETRGPTDEEMRAEVWSAIAGGAKGIGYFTIAFNPFRWNNLTDDVKAELKRTNGQLTELAGPIVLGDTDGKVIVTGDDTDDKAAAGHAIQVIRKQYEGKTYVIAVNVTRQAVKPTFQLQPSLATGTVTAWKENRTLAFTKNKFTDRFKPLEVHVYVLEWEEYR